VSIEYESVAELRRVWVRIFFWSGSGCCSRLPGMKVFVCRGFRQSCSVLKIDVNRNRQTEIGSVLVDESDEL
jgi:hypothetical protein